MVNPMENTGVEKVKLFYDYLKQVAAVSTGSTLLIVAFLEKLFINPRWKWLVVVALICFIVTIALSLIPQFVLLDSFDPETEQYQPFGAIGFLAMSGIFIIGIVSLVVFGLRNFL